MSWFSAVQSSRVSSNSTSRLTVRCGSITFETTVTSDSRAAEEWVRGVRACQPRERPLVVGVDCKWKPTSDAWPSIQNASVVQLCVGTSCLVHQLFVSRCTPSSIQSLLDLDDPDVGFIGVGEDAAKLAHAVGLACVDIEGICDDYFGYFFRRAGVKGFARQELFINLEKPIHVRTSDWGKRDLHADQIKYACVDAYVAYKLGEAHFDDRESHRCEACLRAASPAGCFLHGPQACAVMGHLRPR